MATKTTPPKLKIDTPYTEWKNRLQMWKTVYGYAKKEQAITLLQSLKVVSATFLLVCFVCLKENTCETRKNVFYFTLRAFYVLEIIKF